MSVLLSEGRQALEQALHQVLDEESTGIDWTRGVFLKPNIVFPARPSSGQITSPAFVAAFIRVVRERWNGIDIVMGDGVAVGRDPTQNFLASGFARLAQESGVRLLDLHKAARRPVPWRHGSLDLPAAALDRVYVNLPILKYSSACVVSAAMKNQKGLLTPVMKKEFHKMGLHDQVAELNAAVRPALTILDCSRFFGPNVLISGDNCGEIDATACRLLGIDEPEHVRSARAAGVFTDPVTVHGDIGAVRRTIARPQATEAKRIGRLRLWSSPRACTGCRALFRDARSDLLRPGNLSAKGKLLAHAAKGAEIVMGLEPEWRQEYPAVICVGSCTRDVAADSGGIYVPGCPPTLQDLYDSLP